MRCCGDKRAQLARGGAAQAPPTEASPAEPSARERKPRTFEYTGRGGLTVLGAVSDTVYRFASRGDRVEVAYDDAFAMMAERDVRPTAGS